MEKPLSTENVNKVVQKAVKRTNINSKYQDESISIGQAIVTHHFFNQM